MDYEKALKDILTSKMLWGAIFELVYQHNIDHREEVMASTLCGCHECGAVFPPSEIEDWVNFDGTALCPRCGIDKVIGDASGLPVTEDFLLAFARYCPEREDEYDMSDAWASAAQDVAVSALPMPVCYHGPNGVDPDNLGYAQGVLADGMPFEAEAWVSDGEEWATFFLPAKVLPWRLRVDGDVAEKRADATFTWGSVLADGMALLTEDVDFDALTWLVDYLEERGLIEFAGQERNGSARILADIEGNELVAVDICLSPFGEVAAELLIGLMDFPCRSTRKRDNACKVIRLEDTR